jgi:hypothetical protein
MENHGTSDEYLNIISERDYSGDGNIIVTYDFKEREGVLGIINSEMKPYFRIHPEDIDCYIKGIEDALKSFENTFRTRFGEEVTIGYGWDDGSCFYIENHSLDTRPNSIGFRHSNAQELISIFSELKSKIYAE